MGWMTPTTGKTLKSVIGAVAPSIATALGSPIAGMAIAALSNAFFGKDNATEDEIMQKISSSDVDAFVKLKEIDANFKNKTEELGINLEALYLNDIQDARATSLQEVGVHRYISPLLAIVITLGFFIILVMLIVMNIDPDAKEPLYILVGILGSAWGQVTSFYFGSSIGSRDKDKLINAK